MSSRVRALFYAVAAAVITALPAAAQDSVKIGYIDPLSGGGASVGEVGLKTFQFLADEDECQGRHPGQESRDRSARQQDQRRRRA
jgi:branched-chain amino acid transport system substrate-binding protein